MDAMLMDWMGLLATIDPPRSVGPPGVLGRLGDADAWLTLLGRLHVVAVHFPIALVIVGALIEVLRLPKRRAEAPARWRPSGAGLACIAIGAAAAGVTVWSGWVYADELGAGDEFTTHRWVGVAAAGAAGLAALVGLFAWWRPERGWLAGYRFLGLVAAVLVGLAGHLGGGLTHGDDHLVGPLRVALGMGGPRSPRDRTLRNQSGPRSLERATANPRRVRSRQWGRKAPGPRELGLHSRRPARRRRLHRWSRSSRIGAIAVTGRSGSGASCGWTRRKGCCQQSCRAMSRRARCTCG